MESYVPKVKSKATSDLIELESYNALPWIDIETSGAKVLCESEQGEPMLTCQSYDRSSVWFTQDINGKLPKAILAAFLKQADVKTHVVRPDEPGLHCFRTFTKEGSVYTCFTFPWDQGQKKVEIESGANLFQMVLKDHSMGLLQVLPNGEVSAVETQGRVLVNGDTIISTDAHVMAITLDKKSLTKSSCILILPITAGTVSLRTNAVNCIETGEIVDGSWCTYELINAATFELNTISFEISEYQKSSLFLLYKDGERGFVTKQTEKCLVGAKTDV